MFTIKKDSVEFGNENNTLYIICTFQEDSVEFAKEEGLSIITFFFLGAPRKK